MAELPPLVNPLDKKEPVIHVIPDEFYGAAGKARIPAFAKATVGGPVPAPIPAAATAAGGSKSWLLIPIIAVLLLGGMGFGVWYFVLRQPAPPAASKPVVTLPPVVTPPVPEPEPVVVPEPATTTEPTPPPPPEPAAPTPPPPPMAVDNDIDGLTEVEETLYGTDPVKSDSDSDGFSDSVEVVNLYNPAGFKPTKLIEAGLVTPYDSAPAKYEIYFPTSWTAVADDLGAGSPDMTFTNAQAQSISVAVEENIKNMSVLDWYLAANPTALPSQAQKLFTKSGLEGVISPDGHVAYISANGQIYTITYAAAADPTTAQFKTTFQMMINSLSAKP